MSFWLGGRLTSATLNKINIDRKTEVFPSHFLFECCLKSLALVQH